MTAERPASVVTRWFGVFLADGETLLQSYPFPKDRSALTERMSLRREGRRTPEETRLLEDHGGRPLQSRDRRFEAAGVRWVAQESFEPDPTQFGFSEQTLRELLVQRAESDLAASWDPSVHVQEAVRALTGLDEALNVLGERLTSWAARDRPPAEGEEVSVHRRLARSLSEEAGGGTYGVPDADPGLARARRELAGLYLATERTRTAVEAALTETMPGRAPNLTGLLGPLLAARLIDQAGGLERLARLPASTIQVLGAERAFFEHLRGRAPPPRHGLLFLHPQLQSAPRAQRGRLARALAGKAAIAARLDHAGRPVDASLAQTFAARATAIRSSKRRAGGPARRSLPPLHRTAAHR